MAPEGRGESSCTRPPAAELPLHLHLQEAPSGAGARAEAPAAQASGGDAGGDSGIREAVIGRGEPAHTRRRPARLPSRLPARPPTRLPASQHTCSSTIRGWRTPLLCRPGRHAGRAQGHGRLQGALGLGRAHQRQESRCGARQVGAARGCSMPATLLPGRASATAPPCAAAPPGVTLFASLLADLQVPWQAWRRCTRAACRWDPLAHTGMGFFWGGGGSSWRGDLCWLGVAQPVEV